MLKKENRNAHAENIGIILIIKDIPTRASSGKRMSSLDVYGHFCKFKEISRSGNMLGPLVT